MNLHHFRTHAIALGGATLLLADAACTPTTEVTVEPPAPDQQSGIAVEGTGTVSVPPDIALIDLGVETRAATVAEAREEAAAAMEAVRAAMLAEGVDESDLQTHAFNIYPEYAHAEGEAPQITGYVLNNRLEVTVRDIDDAADVLDAAIVAGRDAVRVNGMRFTVDDPEQYIAGAREEAIENARDRAETLASVAGVTLGEPRSISEITRGHPEPRPVPAADTAGGAETPIEPGEEELEIVVSVVFDIER